MTKNPEKPVKKVVHARAPATYATTYAIAHKCKKVWRQDGPVIGCACLVTHMQTACHQALRSKSQLSLGTLVQGSGNSII